MTVEELAYRFWEERGRPIGSPEVDWHRALEALDEPRDLPLSAMHVGPVTISQQRPPSERGAP